MHLAHAFVLNFLLLYFIFGWGGGYTPLTQFPLLSFSFIFEMTPPTTTSSHIGHALYDKRVNEVAYLWSTYIHVLGLLRPSCLVEGTILQGGGGGG